MTGAEGSLVVDPDGGVSFWTGLPAVVGQVPLIVGDDAAVIVDAADPSLVTAWAVAPGGDLDAPERAFGSPGLGEQLRALVEAGESTRTETAPRLTDAWTRSAVVAAVDRWVVRPLHSGVLVLDRAAALAVAGRTDDAATLFRFAEPTVQATTLDCAEGVVGGGAVRELADIATVATRTDKGISSRFASVAAELHALLAESFDQVLPDWEPTVPAAAAFEDTAAGADYHFVDPSLVPARVLAWDGAAERGLRIAPDGDSVTVSAALFPGLDPTGPEAQQLLAVVADSGTGEILGCHPMRADGDRVLAAVPLTDRRLDTLSFGVIDADTSLDELRLRNADEDRIEVDRWLIEAWNYQRAALAAVGTVGVDGDIAAADALRTRYLRAADTAIANALDTLDDADEQRADAITALRERLPAPAPVAQRPTLAEMLPLDPWPDE